MYNSNKPAPEDLPSSAKLLKSTLIAAIAAAIILITVILPAEYGIDPTRIGKTLGLTSMGEIKTQLAEEAEADRQKEREQQQRNDDQSSFSDGLLNLLVGTAHAQSAEPSWTDHVSLTLKPGDGAEVKLVMEESAVAEFKWTVSGGVVNYDLHGDGGGQNVSYKRGRAVPGHDGSLKAKFTGNHGWFWRNRTKNDVTITLKVRGAYSGVKRTN